MFVNNDRRSILFTDNASTPIQLLLIEDNPGDVRLLRELLAEAQTTRFELFTAESLMGGMNLLSQHDVDVILLDLSLPDSHGLETVKTLHEAQPVTPIVVMTGTNDAQMGIQAVGSGAQDYLIKGEVSGDVLVRSLHYAITRQQIEVALRQSEQNERTQRTLAEALRDTAAALTSTLNTEEVVERVLENLNRVIPHEAANVMLIGDHDTAVVLQHRGSTTLDNDQTLRGISLTGDALLSFQESVASRDVLYEPDLQNQSRLSLPIPNTELQTLLGIPIQFRDDVLGYINVFSKEANAFTPDNVEHLKTFAQQAAIGIQNAQLYEQSQELATIQERQRIARDLHDAVSQTLFTSSVVAESALKQWDINPDKAYTLVEKTHRLTRNALNEMRTLLLELRPQSMERVSLDELFERLVQLTENRKNVSIHLQMDAIPPLPADIKVGLYRIVQEALNNAAKHSGATEMSLIVERLSHSMKVVVTDNGRGFDIEGVNTSSLGLNIMRERAETIGADLEIASLPNSGTQVKIVCPLPLADAAG